MSDAADLSPPAPDAPPGAWLGRTLDGRYLIRELLGEGGMGAVFIAEHLHLHKQVALKIIRAEYTGNEEIAARFRREAMATAQIEHPNVASAMDFGQLPGGAAYLVTQLVRGPMLDTLLLRGRLPWAQAVDVAAQIADALTAAHAAGIIHRDLKPDNIMLEPREDGSHQVKVLDFGVARIAGAAYGAAAAPLTRMGTVVGTPGFMSPEQAMGEPTDHRTDLYALGVILWQCLAGRPLWDGGEISDVLQRQLTTVPPSLAGEIPDMPPDVEKIVQQLLARDARHRPASAREARDALRAVLRPPAPATVIPPPTAPARSRWPLVVGGVLALAGAVALIFAWPKGQGAGEPGDTGGPPVEAYTGEVDMPVDGKVGDALPDEEPGPGDSAIDVGDLPAALADHARKLHGNDRKVRVKAGEAVLAHEPEVEVPAWLRAVALLETSETCESKRAAVKRISEAQDKRGLPALQRLGRTPRKGCGAFKNKDCLDCLRATLAKAMQELAAP